MQSLSTIFFSCRCLLVSPVYRTTLNINRFICKRLHCVFMAGSLWNTRTCTNSKLVFDFIPKAWLWSFWATCNNIELSAWVIWLGLAVLSTIKGALSLSIKWIVLGKSSMHSLAESQKPDKMKPTCGAKYFPGLSSDSINQEYGNRCSLSIGKLTACNRSL